MNNGADNFLFLCECLSLDHDPHLRENINNTIKRHAIDWGPVIAVASGTLMVPTLWNALKHKNLVDGLDDDLKFYLSGFYDLNRQRNILIRRQAEQIVGALNESGIEPILLKGAALMFMDEAGAGGYRIMSDIDILAREEDVQKYQEVLISLGYEVYDQDLAATHDSWLQHLPPMTRAGDPASIELHTGLFHVYDDSGILSNSECFQRARSLQSGSLSFKVLSPTDFIIHNVTHSEINHKNFSLGNVSLRSLYDFATLSGSKQDEIDWDFIEGKMLRHGVRRVYSSYIYMASVLLGAKTPPGFQPSLNDRMHLRRCLLVQRFSWLGAIFSYWPLSGWKLKIVFRNLTYKGLKKRYGCPNTFWAINKMRFRYLWFVFKKYVLTIR